MARYQSFDSPQDRSAVPDRLRALREWMRNAELDGLLIPDSDPYLSEFTNPSDARLAWATGFTGSTGSCLVLAEQAFLFLDGRYVQQGQQETDPQWIEVVDLGMAPIQDWLVDHVPPQLRVGYDPRLHSIDGIARLADSGIELIPYGIHPIDALWTDRPRRPRRAVRVHPLDLAGESSLEKRTRLAEIVRRDGLDATFITAPESVCWLFNIRGNDTPHTPVVQARAILYANGDAVLFLDPERITPDIGTAMGDGVRVRPEDELPAELQNLAERTLSLNAQSTPKEIEQLGATSKVNLVLSEDIASWAKVAKNSAELTGARRAHLLDGIAMVEFLAWFDGQSPEALTEIDVVEALEHHRIASGELNDIAFDSIAAAGPNSALPHYRVTSASNRSLQPGEFLLTDSGGQYRMGTTDISRTLPVGEISPAMRASYTTVLKAMIAMSTVRFPPDTPGIMIDAVARQILWSAGKDYAHSTGHGVGACLSVHEGPIAISPSWSRGSGELVAGTILSNEPAFYLPNQYGVRIENLVLVQPADTAPEEHIPTHRFETLTLVPINTLAILPEMLDSTEREWLNTYHARVQDALESLVSPPAQTWLRTACQPI